MKLWSHTALSPLPCQSEPASGVRAPLSCQGEPLRNQFSLDTVRVDISQENIKYIGSDSYNRDDT